MRAIHLTAGVEIVCTTYYINPMARKPNINTPFHQFAIGFIYPFSAFCNRGPIKDSKSIYLFNTSLMTKVNSKNYIGTRERRGENNKMRIYKLCYRPLNSCPSF
jgi:hypothetical protein